MISVSIPCRLKSCLSVIFLLLSSLNVCAQSKPKIGLTLSGGGAKGLAHIGVLSAIDSAGLQIDYVTGTSMGGVMGGLYALGYSGDSIRKIANTIDWNLLLSNKPLLSSVSIEEKKELNRYAVELPFTRWKPTPFTGIIDGQELWITLKKYFLPAHKINDFSLLPKGFTCIGTDIETGDPVVLKAGNLTDAVRATMAIPSVFTSVEYDGRTLVDGGLLRNFPVSDVKELGADIIIGVNVGAPLAKADELNSPVSVLYQVTGFADAHDHDRQKKLCDIFIEPDDILSYTAASFGSADSIIKIGYEEGRKQYPKFKALADSLNKLYPNSESQSKNLLRNDSVYISKISFRGIEEDEMESIKAIFSFEEKQYYTAETINEKIRRVYGTRNFVTIKYDIITDESGVNELLFDVTKASSTIIKAGLHYNTYSKAALVAGVTIKNKFVNRSKFYSKFNISENPRAILEWKKYFGSLDKYSVNLSYNYTSFRVELAVNNEGFADYRAVHQTAGINFSRYFKNKMITLGSDIYLDRLRPLIGNILYIDGKNSANSAFIQFYLNTLDRTIYPTKGWMLNSKVSYIFNQNPDIKIYLFDDAIDSESENDAFNNFPALLFKSINYLPLSRKSSIYSSYNLGVNFENSNTLNGNYYLGGLVDFEYNQIPFSGLSHTEIITNSCATFGLGWQYNISGKLYSKLHSNIGLYSFDNITSIYEITAENNFVSGYSATLGLETLLGPVEFSVIYNDLNFNVGGYVNIGLHF